MTTRPPGALDFNQLLRDSRHLETAMDGMVDAYSARPQTGHGGHGTGAFTPGAGGIALGATALKVPTLQRNLQQLSTASRRLARQQVPSDINMDSQAQLLLSAKGIDLKKQQRALKEMELSLPARHLATVTPVSAGIESFHPLDIDRFLQHQQQLLCHTAMEEAAKVTSDTYRLHELHSLADDWEVSKREILDQLGFRGGKSALGLAGGAGGSAAEQEAKRKSPTAMTGASTMAALHPGPTGPVLAMEQSIYARTIQELNRSRVRRHPVNLLQMLKQASAHVDEFFERQATNGQQQGGYGLTQGDVADCWDVLRFMLQDGSNSSNNALLTHNTTDDFKSGEPLGEKIYSAAWNAPSNSPEHTRLQSQLISGAKFYSEQLFETYIKRVVSKYPVESRKIHQGKSTFLQHIATYVTILSAQLPPVSREVQFDGVPFWPQVYFAYRCGHIGTALELLHKHLGQGVPAATFGRSGSSLTSTPGSLAHSHEQNRVLIEVMETKVNRERSLHANAWLQLHEEYQRELNNAVNSARAHGNSSAHAGAYADPFKLALYHLLGRFKLPPSFDISPHVAPTTEDYLWLKLSILYDGGSSAAFDGLNIPESLRDSIDANAMNLDTLQADLLNRGENAFNPDGRHPLSYFKILLLSQQFEQAVYYLIKTPHFSVGVHFAIALDYYGILHPHANPSQELLIAQPSQVTVGEQRFALNYSRILRRYVEAFVRTHPIETFHYLYLLHTNVGGASAKRRGQGIGNTNFPGSDEMDADEDELPSNQLSSGAPQVNPHDPSFTAMRDLLLETRDYERLVGTIISSTTNQGAVDSIQTQRGLIYNYYTRAEAQYLLVQTAATMETHGFLVDAIQLYLLAYRFDLAVELLLKSLSPVIPQSIQTSERQSLVELAQKVQRVVRNQQAHLGHEQRFRGNQQSESSGDVSDQSFHALHQLLLLVNYFDLYHLGPQHYESALVILSSNDLDLIPFSSDDVNDRARKFENSSMTHLAVKRCISEVAISLMDIYYVQFQILKREMQAQPMYGGMVNIQRDQSKQQRLQSIRAQARALLSFLGLIHSSMQIDADVFGKLVSIEALMAA